LTGINFPGKAIRQDLLQSLLSLRSSSHDAEHREMDFGIDRVSKPLFSLPIAGCLNGVCSPLGLL